MVGKGFGRVCALLLTAWTIGSTAVTPAQKPDGPDPGYRPSRTQDGQPDLQGVWQVLNSAAWDIQDHPAQLFPGLPPRFAIPAGQGVVEGNVIPYQSWASMKRNENYETRLTTDPEASCYLPGVPRITYMPYPFHILQFSDRVVILYEYLHATREIYLDGSPHPKGPLDLWLGDSRGRWEGDTLIVDVIHFTDQTWLDRAGNFHSAALHVVERYTRTSADHLLYEVTLDDPKVFTRPWKMSMPLYRRQEKGVQLLEFECYAYAREAADKDVK